MNDETKILIQHLVDYRYKQVNQNPAFKKEFYSSLASLMSELGRIWLAKIKIDSSNSLEELITELEYFGFSNPNLSINPDSAIQDATFFSLTASRISDDMDKILNNILYGKDFIKNVNGGGNKFGVPDFICYRNEPEIILDHEAMALYFQTQEYLQSAGLVAHHELIPLSYVIKGGLILPMAEIVERKIREVVIPRIMNWTAQMYAQLLSTTEMNVLETGNIHRN